MSEARGQVQMRAVSGDEAGLRLDRWFQRHYPELSHGALQKLLRTGQVRLDGKRVEAKDRVEPGQTVRLPPGVTATPAPKPKAAAPQLSERDSQEIQSLVIHRDDWVIALNKPAGLAVQGGSGTERHVDGLLDGLRFGFEDRPRLVHRLDKDTSGLLLIARTGQAAKRLSESFRDRETEKLYWAVVVGVPPRAEGAIDLPLAKRPGARDRETMQVDHEEGQKALTHFKILDRAGNRAALLALWPRTGRTHQLRVHCACIGCPILGDRKYGGEEALLAAVADSRRLHLHARRLVLPHPSGKGTLELQAEAPSHFKRTVEAFGFSTAGDRA
jgi:23S rRNA pseudouridine955/2504/2580 synthase